MDLKELLGDSFSEDMTLDDVMNALKEVDTPKDQTEEIERLKKAVSKANSEAAGYKRELKEKMTEEEQRQADEAEARQSLEEKYDALLHKTTVAEHKAKLLALGYEEKLAAETAEALVNGDSETVFANQKKHLDAVEKKVRAETLKNTPRPVGDGENKTMTLNEFRKLSPDQRFRFSQNNPEEYRTLYEGGTE